MRRKNISNEKRISLPMYKKIIELMPIPCVDVVFKFNNNVYLFKRAYEPAKDEWWLIGGRILKGETFKEAAKRKVKEEVGVEVKVGKMIGIYEEFFTKSRFDTNKIRKKGTHTLSICFVAEPSKKGFKFRLNDEYKGYKIINKIEGNLEPYIKTVLKDSRIFI